MSKLASFLERPLRAAPEPLRPLDAIVVLGAPLGPNNRLTPAVLDRVEAAADLWHAGGAPVVLASGGVTGDGEVAEAVAIADALHERGVTNLLVEAEAMTTADNARYSAAMLLPRGARTAWIVTHTFHGRRAARLFRRAGLEPHVWPVGDARWGWVAREYAAWGALWLRRQG